MKKMAYWAVRGSLWDTQQVDPYTGKKKGSPPKGAGQVIERNGKLVIKGTARVVGFTSRKAQRRYNRERRQEAREERLQRKREAKQRKDTAIRKLKVDQLAFLDVQIGALKKAPKRVSPRGAAKERKRAEKRAYLTKVRKDLSTGESDMWYDKFQRWLKPTEQKFRVMNRRLSVRPRLAR